MSNVSTTAKPPTNIAFIQPMPTRKHDALDVRCPRHCKQASMNTGSYHGKIKNRRGEGDTYQCSCRSLCPSPKKPRALTETYFCNDALPSERLTWYVRWLKN
ncbi:hypothetical protein CDEST_12267 [Colletotrichum destructivum]|uniref:Uncharacterized protein n=1 Tax=Colletotrichum destructivum TaxID=34406 RepID=A0AAX4IVE8_9PEZI|nr:hypothetical protein CDEST_12267 [Colletotrichum destructivum]